MKKVAVLGAGSWGTALATVLADNDFQTFLWARNEKEAQKIQETRKNTRYLPGVTLHKNIEVVADIKKAVIDSSLIIFSVPSQALRETLKKIIAYIPEDCVFVNTAKGLETSTLLRLSQVMEEELPNKYKDKIAVLSGPSHAEEVGQRLPTAIVAASYKKKTAEFVQDSFMTPFFRVYTNTDVVGVELGGALKNIIALAAGISDGLGYGDNSKSALMTRGLIEIARLGKEMSAEPLTFAGLSGVGDLIVTCTSMHSRNRRAGIALGKGKPLDEVLKEMGMVVEGINSTKATYTLSRKLNVEMPITEQMHRILYTGDDPREGVKKLMQRQKKHEMEEVVDKKLLES